MGRGWGIVIATAFRDRRTGVGLNYGNLAAIAAAFNPNVTLCFRMEFVVGLSVISRGSNTEKLEWIFDLYDINKRGCIRQTELLLVVQSIYELLGRHTDPPISRRAIVDHVIDVFKGTYELIARQKIRKISLVNKLLR
ncbi:Calsenilin [Toxocara canis]|uniref:Calsenilin n=1 Tax=Toxocara canis TaxID=6265 RepID=A0A0B2V041_TOXCA|nr:Calsenilin [Toxocara canis]